MANGKDSCDSNCKKITCNKFAELIQLANEFQHR